MTKILVIGELCKDIFIYGDCKRLSPEAPVPVFTPIDRVKNDGMAGNVVLNLKAIDPTIKTISLHQHQLITKTRYVEKKSNHMFLRVDEGEDKVELLNLDQEIIDIIKKVDAVIVSDYDKGFLNDELLLKITEHAKFCVMDSKRHLTPELINAFDFIKLNESEYNKHSFTTNEMEKIVVTLGSKGSKYMDQIFPSPEPKETIDVSGAGDTFTAAFTLKYIETGSVPVAIKFANLMASIVVSKRGVATP